jgi:hypothetical protein
MSSPRPPSAPKVRRDEYGFDVVKAARPVTRTGAAILAAGGLAHVVAVFLPWYSVSNVELKGLDEFLTPDGAPFYGPGKIWLVVGGLLFALGVTMYILGRIFWIAIAAVLVAILGVFTSLLGVGAASNVRNYNGGGEIGAGCWIGIMSILLALAGSIQVLAKRRR